MKATFKGSKFQERQLKEVINAHKDQPGGVMPVLQQAQDIYGYLPFEVQAMIAEELNMSLSEIYGIATFYSQFSLNPKGDYQISVCMGTACYVKGAEKIVVALEEKLGIKNGECTKDGIFSLDTTRCIGACGLAPVMSINDDIYGKVEVAQLDEILVKYQKKKKN